MFHVIPAIGQREYSHPVAQQHTPTAVKKKKAASHVMLGNSVKIQKGLSPRSSMESVVLESKTMQLNDRSPEVLKQKAEQMPKLFIRDTL